MIKTRSKLSIVPALVLLLLLAPIGAATLSLFNTATKWHGQTMGEHTAGGQTTIVEANVFQSVLETPGFWASAGLSYWMGLATAFISLIVVMLFTATFQNTKLFAFVAAFLKPVLAVPHAAAAFGLLFLIAPSGFLIRLVSPELSGFIRPPDWLIVNDPAGISFALGLIIKEIPFLFFVTMIAIPQSDPRRIQIASSLGYGQVWGWLISVFPAIYLQIRLPVFAVIAFASANVDVALILGPVAPPNLAVRVLHWMNDPDLTMRAMAAAGAIVQVTITLFALLTWWVGEHIVLRIARFLTQRGWRAKVDVFARFAAAVTMGLSLFIVSVGLLLLMIWSFAEVWRFPDVFPQVFTVRTWLSQAGNLLETGIRATVIGLSASALSLGLVLASLENEYRSDIRLRRLAWWTIYIPLLVPQIALMGGLSVLFLRFNIDGTLWAVILVHMIFVFPYVYLMLADPWNAFDTRYLGVARTLGKSADQAFWSIRLPILLRPVLGALALGFAVSIAQYLPTLLIGAGRQPTITTEAIALASGGNRRLIGAYALVQTLLPFLVFALASLIPNIVWANRRALQVIRID